MEKRVKYLFIFSLILLVSFVGATNGDINDTIIRLSSDVNSHAELYNQTNYLSKIDYSSLFGSEFSGIDHPVCNSTNTLFYLSGLTNAHASLISSSVYSTPVCYGNLGSCEYVATGDCPSNKTCIVKLSGETNAHLALCNSLIEYGKVCCANLGVVSQSPDVFSSLYWLNNGQIFSNDESEPLVVYSGKDGNIYMSLNTYDSSYIGETVKFTLFSQDGEIDSSIGVVGNDNTSVVSFIFPADYIEENGEEYIYELYFKTNLSEEQSNIIYVIAINANDACLSIDFCASYTDEDSCLKDVCGIADQSSSELTCGEKITLPDGTTIEYDCGCSWNINTSICDSNWTINFINNSNTLLPTQFGTCVQTQFTEDSCEDDGFLTYTWTGIMDWADENSIQAIPNMPPQYVPLGGPAPYHYNPDEMYEKCINTDSKTITVSCPSYTRLGFVSFWNIVIAIILILIIYLIAKIVKDKKKSVKSSVKSKKKRKKIQKK